MRFLLRIAAISAALLDAAAIAQVRPEVATPDPSSYIPAGPVSAVAAPAGMRNPLTGLVQVGIKLQDAPLVTLLGSNAKQNGITLSADEQRGYLAQLKQKQDAVMSQVKRSEERRVGKECR